VSQRTNEIAVGIALGRPAARDRPDSSDLHKQSQVVTMSDGN